MTRSISAGGNISQAAYEERQAQGETIKVGKKGRQVINSVIKAESGMVLVFDDNGEQIPEYQGQYEEVKARILKNAPPSAVFSYAFDNETGLRTVPREEW